jgi:anhydro-N-acetylmuramic acid kinase
MFGIKTKSTLQIGDLSVIANLTDITTVGDFRTADAAVGGGGAPLVPFLDYILFSNPGKNVLALNIGGIANITYIGKNSGPENLTAFDTGPGNMVIDALVKIYFQKDFDNDGSIADRGKVNNRLLNELYKFDIFPLLSPPKSTGRERYGIPFINFILNWVKENKNITSESVIATLTEYTAVTVYNNYKNILAGKGEADELVISGGGAKNKYLMERLKYYFSKTEIKILNQNGITIENKEAVLFAVLGNETLCGNTSNICSVTGANKKVILGKICL